MRDFYKEIGDILGAGGVAYAIVPIGDATKENAAHTTVTTVGAGAGNGLVFTYSEARTSFDAATEYRRNRGRLPRQIFNGSDEDATTPSAAFWSRDDSGAAPWSVGCWLFLNATALAQALLTKFGAGGSQEWLFRLEAAEKLALIISDDSTGAQAERVGDVALPMGVALSTIAVYDGRGGATAADGITLYTRGAVEASTATNSGSYVAMEPLGAKVEVASAERVTSRAWLNGSMYGGPLGPFFTHNELSAVAIQNLHQIGLAAQKEAPSLVIPRRKLVKV